MLCDPQAVAGLTGRGGCAPLQQADEPRVIDMLRDRRPWRWAADHCVTADHVTLSESGYFAQLRRAFLIRAIGDCPDQSVVPGGRLGGGLVCQPVGAPGDLGFDLAERSHPGGIGDVGDRGDQAGDRCRAVACAARCSGEQPFDSGVDDSGDVFGIAQRGLGDSSLEDVGDADVRVFGATEFGDEGAVRRGGLESCLVGGVEAAGGDGLAVAVAVRIGWQTS
jgi:hypothetical protein